MNVGRTVKALTACAGENPPFFFQPIYKREQNRQGGRMKVDITARHFSPSDTLRDYALKKVNKVDRYLDNTIGCHVILTHENAEQIAEIKLSVSGKKIFVKETSEDMLKSIDGAVDKLVSRVIRFKTTRYSHS
ncbi:MAG: ribosome hibernation-promoting factor, HPF/YfiA family [Fidelibacterota bacterium]